MKANGNTVLNLIQSFLFWVILIILVIPVVWLFLLSFRPVAVIMGGLSEFFQGSFTLGHYLTTLKQTFFFRWLFNSTFVALTTTVICIFLGILAGYVIGRTHSTVAHTVVILILVAQLFPEHLLAIPMYLLMRIAHISNTYVQIIIAHMSFTLPLSVWLIANYIRQVPIELEEAAHIDGAGWGQILRLVLLPIIWPGVAAASVLAFIRSWGNFIWGFLFANEEKYFLLPVGIQNFSAEVAYSEYGIVLAISVLYILPVMLFFIIQQRGLVKGLSSGAIKG